MRPYIIYHGNCADGFGAAWVLWKYFKGEADFYPGVYQRPPPNVEGRDVFVVDFSYKRPVMLELARRNNFTLVLDHHKTAQADLRTDDADRCWQAPDSREVSWLTFVDETCDSERGDMYTVFDMERSGAGLAWDFFNPGEQRPRLINHIEDRDLWRFALPSTREIQASMFSLPYDFELWDTRFTHFEWNEKTRQEVIAEGAAIERKHHKDIAELIEVVTRPMKFRVPGNMVCVVPVANLPYTLTSDAGHLLCRRDYLGGDPGGPHPFAGCYWDKPDGRQFSLRSRDDGADVAEIAKLYGGGGHARASGFTVPYDRLAEFEP